MCDVPFPSGRPGRDGSGKTIIENYDRPAFIAIAFIRRLPGCLATIAVSQGKPAMTPPGAVFGPFQPRRLAL